MPAKLSGFIALGSPLVLTLTGGGGAGDSQSTTKQPARKLNALFIAADDLNNDIDRCGRPLVKSPNLDRFARRGVKFDRAYCRFPLCSPSRSSLMTGLRPDTARVYDLRKHFRETLPDVVTLPQLFRRNGYVAARVGKIYHYGDPGDVGAPGLDEPPSWDVVVNPKGIVKEVEKALTNLTPRRGLGSSLSLYASPAPDAERTDGEFATETIKPPEQNRDRPSFIAAGSFRPHCPYIAPQKYFDLYPLEKIAAPRFSPSQPLHLNAIAPEAELVPVLRRYCKRLFRDLRRVEGAPSL